MIEDAADKGRQTVAQFESFHLIVMKAWKPASLKAMPPQSNTM